MFTLLKLKHYTFDEMNAFLKTLKNCEIKYETIENENAIITPVEEIEHYCDEPELRAFKKEIFTNKGKVYNYAFADVRFSLDEYTFFGTIWKLRREFEEESFYVIEAITSKTLNLKTYKFGTKKNGDKMIFTVKNSSDFEEIAPVITLEEYLKGNYERRASFYFESDQNLINHYFFYNFKTGEKHYHNKNFDCILFDRYYNFIGVLENHLTKEFLNEILTDLFDHIFLQDEDEIFYIITKFEIGYQIVRFGEEKNSDVVVSHEDFIDYVANNIKLKRVFTTR